jgi:peptide deformylase
MARFYHLNFLIIRRKNDKIIDMSIKNIITIPNKILSQKSEKIQSIDADVKKIITELIETANAQTNPEAAGLAAPQIGYNKKIILVRDFKMLPNSEKMLITNIIMINPRIISESKEIETDWESCLSIPYMYGKVSRPYSIKVTYLDENGNEKKIKARDFQARVIQHEIDHLNGILFDSKIIGKLITETEYNKIIDAEHE